MNHQARHGVAKGSEMNKNITKRQERAFMAARHPGMKYHKETNSWIGGGRGMDRSEVIGEAIAELEQSQEAMARMPAWASA